MFSPVFAPPSLPRANTDNDNRVLLPTPSATPIKTSNTQNMFPIQHHQHPTLTRANSSTSAVNLMALSPLRTSIQPSYSPLGTPNASTTTRQSGGPAPIARPPAARRADTMALVSPAVDSTLHLAGQSLATGLDVAARRADIIHDLQELAEHQHHPYHHLGGAAVHHQQQQVAPSPPTAYFQQSQQQQPAANPFAATATSPDRYQQQQQQQQQQPRPTAAPAVSGISLATAARLMPPSMERHISVPSVLPSWLQPALKPNPPPTQPSPTAAQVHRAQASPRAQGFTEPTASARTDLARDRDPWRAANCAWEQQQQQPLRAVPMATAGSPQWPAAGADVHTDVMSQAGETFSLFQVHGHAMPAPASSSAAAAYYAPHHSVQQQQQPRYQPQPQQSLGRSPAQMSHLTHASPAMRTSHTFHSPQSPFTQSFQVASPALTAYAAVPVPHNTPIGATANTFLLMGSPLGSPPASTFLASVPPNTPTAAAGADQDDLGDMQVSAPTPHYRFETTDSFDPTAPLFLTPAPAVPPAQGQGGYAAAAGDVGLVGALGQQAQQATQQVYVPLDLFGGGAAVMSPTAMAFFGQAQPMGQQQQQTQFVQLQQGGYQGGGPSGFMSTSKMSPNYGNLDESMDQQQLPLNLVPGLNFTMGSGQHHHHHHHGNQHLHPHPNAPPLTPDPNAFALDKKLQPLVWSPTPNPVIRINNISWDMTIFDIQHYLHPLSIAHLGGLPLIHILMVRETGKTRSDAYVELDTMNDAMVALRERQRRILRGRVVTLHRASQAELLRLLFPSFVGEFHLVDAVPAGERDAEEGVATSYVSMQRMFEEQRANEGASGGGGAQSAGANAAWLDAFARLALPGVGGGESSLGQRSSAGESMASSFSSAASGGRASSTTTSTQGSPNVGQPSGRQHVESVHGIDMVTQPPTPAPQQIMAMDQQGKLGQREHVFLTRTEINQILSVCKNYKLFFSRKCSQRPFENVIVILLKFPWHQRHLLSTLQRDHLFELTKLAIESLRSHLHKPAHAMDPTLLDRMVRAALLVPAFTDRQKAIVLEVAGKVGMAKWVGLEEACREIGAAVGRMGEEGGGDRGMMGQQQGPPPPPVPAAGPTGTGAGMPPLPSALAHQLGVWSPHVHSNASLASPNPHLDPQPPMSAARQYRDEEVDIDFGGGGDNMDVSESGFGFGGAGRMFGTRGGDENSAGMMDTPPRPTAAAGYHSPGGLATLSPKAPAFIPRYSAAGDVSGGFQMRDDQVAGPAVSVEGGAMQQFGGGSDGGHEMQY